MGWLGVKVDMGTGRREGGKVEMGTEAGGLGVKVSSHLNYIKSVLICSLSSVYSASFA